MAKPTIRFRGFDDEWEQRKVSEMATEKLSNGIMNNQANDETGLKHINVSNMYTPDKIHPEELTFSSYDEDAVKKCNVEWGDIFLTRSSLKPEGIAEANVLLDSGRFIYDDHLIRLKIDKEKYDPFFVKLNLSGSSFKRQFIARAKTTAFTTIGQEDIAECSGLFPKKKEQEKIGVYFSSLDRLITLHQRKRDETKKLKKYMLQKMFPQNGKKVPKIRFEGFTDEWEQRKFGEITELKSASRVHKDEWTSNGVPFYRSSDVMAAINGTENEKAFISEELYEKLSKVSGKLEEGDILVTGGGSVGNPYIVPDNKPLYTKDADLLWIKNKGKFHPYFLYEFFFSPTFRNYLGSISHVGTIAHYTITQLSDTPICLPSFEEQKEVGEYFQSLDRLITLHQRKCEELKKLKKFMLQNMFSQEK